MFLALIPYVTTLAIVVGAMLVAVQTRLRITAGLALGNEYTAEPPALFLIILVVVVAVVSTALAWNRTKGLSKRLHFGVIMLSVVLVGGATVFLLPDVSLLQLVYFGIYGLIISVAVILLPANLERHGKATTLLFHMSKLWENRTLLVIWVTYNIRSRYSQTILGVLWIALLPLATSLILALVFSRIIRVSHPGDVPHIAYYFAAMVAWQWFSQGILNGMGSILGRLDLIKQVYFPREIIVLVKMGEAMLDFVVTFCVMLVINALVGIWPNANFIYLPALFIIQACFMLGLMFFLSYITVVIRDIPQLVAVGLQLLFYLTPIIFSVSNIPERLRFLVLINPLALMIDAYRSIIVYNVPPDPVNLYYPAVIAGVLLYTGYIFFKAHERRITDFL